MFKNYLIIALKVFQKRKFFTFINLFGIVLTMSVLVVGLTLLENYIYPGHAEKNHDNMLSVSYLRALNKERTQSSSSDPGYYFLNKYVKPLKSADKVSIFSSPRMVSVYLDGQQVKSRMRLTDADYFSILDFNFKQGSAYQQDDFEQGRSVAVINQHTKSLLFNDGNAIGEKIKFDEKVFTVVGVVDNVSLLEQDAYSDIWVPYTTAPSSSYKTDFMGGWGALIYVDSEDKRQFIQSEYINALKNHFEPYASTGSDTVYATVYSTADTKFSRLARDINNSRTFDTGDDQLLLMLGLIAIAFMLLPSINMINLNVSRILERSTEIGVRKSFGASSGHLVIQFLIENILLTLIGAAVSLIISIGILEYIEYLGLIPYAELSINTSVVVITLVLSIFFGTLSGIYPAYRMSKLNPVIALKGAA
ncbi:ABC transporter permease [Pleionea sp. CnH1-48]|uniref:ABC transporter permease n=1 Tax=Pleionea sp. CnH1-48 TaxID=2954494 RepID=UPI0020973725|nr:ABC transporter permease [Pleionea sp. CnH1-48]MCO7226037.1 ABC transporter permease [Pleionea sp. CnH1-48]